jgi:NAD(P)-dependent dehydrogenase (short-subunit alcohol dehydrogenase family)
MTTEPRRAVVVGDDLIAAASARRLLADGYEVLLAGPPGSAAVDGAKSVDVELGDPSGAATAIAAAAAEWPAVHALVNCHMQVAFGTVVDVSLDDWERALAVNATGPLLTTRALLDPLTAAGGAAVVHLGSVDGLFGNPLVAAYSASKATLVPLTHLMAHELAPRGIRVNCIARALVETPGPNPFGTAIISATPLARPALADEIAGVVAFLVGPDSAYVTGAVIPVDGGRTGITRGTA